MDRICYQSQPSVFLTALGPWIKAYLSNNTESFYKQFPSQPPPPPVPANLTEYFPPLLPAETDDCLFLDVHVPKKIFDQKGYRTRTKKGAPVFLWVHGGGLILGHKGSDTDFKGLLAKSQEKLKEPVIVVSINYRVSGRPQKLLIGTQLMMCETAWRVWLLRWTEPEGKWWCFQRRTSGSTACVRMGTEIHSSFRRRSSTGHRGW